MHETKSKMYVWNFVVPWHHTCSGYATVQDHGNTILPLKKDNLCITVKPHQN